MELPLDVEPGRNPNVFEAQRRLPEQNLDRQEEHDDQQRLHHDVLQQAHARVDLPAERCRDYQLVNTDPCRNPVSAEHCRAEYVFDDVLLMRRRFKRRIDFS